MKVFQGLFVAVIEHRPSPVQPVFFHAHSVNVNTSQPVFTYAKPTAATPEPGTDFTLSFGVFIFDFEQVMSVEIGP